ncbi:MAG: 50S ribosomal protein L21e [Candidatus Methanogasteraceae archaeon]|uniref:Large ribosomal subunit protein eL21 n=1 Tax=Candidatus Methanogaster sp. ANME-2c ERB4 TaxID=2759911 RepID=A0A7G9YME0_9EURY|nr:MAG: 50S ribosomal protein L21e [ANME-2 cluster archaeon]QNO47584.1 50S ribosomal protein L21e [Methanosarcinales archaeon ANME-2c ERB4]QNO49174.1 50S ribosomal protein L21e [Methanosarcinales archaeon ANME-2c ERB4]
MDMNMAKSHGERRKTRHKLRKPSRRRGLSAVSKAIQEFEMGDMVHIIIDPSVHSGMPNPKFHGHTGTVVARRGRAYILNVRDGNAMKNVITYPQHLSPQQ